MTALTYASILGSATDGQPRGSRRSTLAAHQPRGWRRSRVRGPRPSWPCRRPWTARSLRPGHACSGRWSGISSAGRNAISIWANGIAKPAVCECQSTRSSSLSFTAEPSIRLSLSPAPPLPCSSPLYPPVFLTPTSPDSVRATTHVQQLMVHRSTLKQLRDKHLVPLPGPLVREQLGIWVHAEQVRDEYDPVDFAVALPVLGR